MDEERECTNILWVGFVLTMLVAAIFMFNKGNLPKINFPTDSD